MSSEQAEKPMENGENEAEAKTENEPATAPNTEITKSAKEDVESSEIETKKDVETDAVEDTEVKSNDPDEVSPAEQKTTEEKDVELEIGGLKITENDEKPTEPEDKPVAAEAEESEKPKEQSEKVVAAETEESEKPKEQSEKVEDNVPSADIEAKAAEESKVKETSKDPEKNLEENAPQAEHQTEAEPEKAEEVTEKPLQDASDKPTEEPKGDDTTAIAEEKQNGAAEGAVGGEVNPKNLHGKYVHVKSENVEDLFRALGLPWMLRKVVTRFSPTTDIIQDGDKFHIKIVTGFKTKEWKFTVGEDFEEKFMGWSSDTVIVDTAWDDNKLVMNSKPKSEKSKAKPLKVTRHLNGEELTMVMEVDDVVCTRVFKRKK